MLETTQLLATFDALVTAGKRGVLATVVHVRGSTYRLPGTRMLLGEDGTMTGLVSGGCLEADLLERIELVLENNESTSVHYDYTSEDDIVWGLGLGCAGVVDVLLEPVDRDKPGPLSLLRSCLQSRLPGYIASGISANGQLAGRWLQYPDGTTVSHDWPGQTPDFTLVSEHRTSYEKSADGHILYERIDPSLRLVIFGAGPDVVPLARMADSLGWDVEVYDHRPSYIRPDRFPSAVTPRLCRPEEAESTVAIDQRTAVLLMTHHYPSDKTLLEAFAQSTARYIGALGPRQRTDLMLDEIGTSVDSDKLYAPVGLDIGGEAPEDIALAIIAEIQSVFNDRQGGYLRTRGAPIHERRD